MIRSYLSNSSFPHRLPSLVCFSVFAIVICGSLLTCVGQRGGGLTTLGTGQNILYGDVKVDEAGVTTNKPFTYTVVLYMTAGTVIGRQTVGNGQRYSFNDLADGEYDIAVEVENREITRSRVRLFSQPNVGKTDTRHDIELELRENGVATKGGATVSAEDFYKRSSANEKLFTSGKRATDDKKYDDAIATLKQLITNDPNDFQAWTELGTAYLLKDNAAEAEASYQRAIEVRPKFFLANMTLGRLYLAEKKFNEAVEVLNGAVKLQPQSADANQLLGEAYLQIKKGSLAVGYLNEAIRLDPKGKAEIHLRLALLYNNAGMKDKAAVEYEAFLKQRPDYKDKKKLEQYILENKKP
ncbi:MAG TPA: tetratricopeptide repeat protein [Pyrinomonadaceae bacterium]|nr:tetratricopeptide repeat protein [Pyrinomonadaceae bacterium]